jgi:hypothetical protein
MFEVVASDYYERVAVLVDCLSRLHGK